MAENAQMAKNDEKWHVDIWYVHKAEIILNTMIHLSFTFFKMLKLVAGIWKIVTFSGADLKLSPVF